MNKPASTIRHRFSLCAGLVSLALIAAGCGTGTAARAPQAPKHHHVRLLALAHGRVQRARRHVPIVHAAPFPQRRAFARQILPILDQSASIFDHAVAAVSSAGGVDNIDGPCGDYLSQVQIESSYADGVPHPFTWFSAAGALHHQMEGVYHDMAGALVACQTAVQAQDSGAASTAIADMSQAASEMHSLDSYTRWLAQH